jgi:hypothetical protein
MAWRLENKIQGIDIIRNESNSAINRETSWVLEQT